jgi:hypothetical protein
MLDTLTKIFVAGNALVWIGFGPAFYFAPEALAGQLDIALHSPTALADFRAMYGGAPLGIGIIMAMGLWRTQWMKPALLTIVLCTAGLLLGRLITMASPGGVGSIIYLFSAIEAVTIVAAAWLYRVQPRLAG